jgi:hypothetical protein
MLSLGRSKVLAAVGLILTVAVAALAFVAQARLAQARLAQAQQPQENSSAIGPWSDSLAEYGMPAAPTPWRPTNWDVQIHTRGMQSDAGNEGHNAEHGADCSAPPATHFVNSWQQAVFVCHSHVMTAISDSGYGEVVLTPDRLADWSAGPVTIGFSVSTLRTTSRDWITVDVTPFGEQLALPFDFGGVDLQGMPAHYVHLTQSLDTWNTTQTNWHMVREGSSSFGDTQSTEWPYFEDATGIPMSASVRTPFELTISSAGYTFRVAPSAPKSGGKVLLQGAWSKPLTFTQGVVQFAHHSYDPFKCGVTALRCYPNTWHWSDFSISRAVPYTLLRPVDLPVVTQPGGVVAFAQGAPANSLLKFAAIGAVQVSYDGGASYTAAQQPPMDTSLSHEEHFTNYLTPVPAGARSVQFKLAGGWYGRGMARDFSLVSLTTSGSPAPTPGSPPTPTQPTATPLPPMAAPLLIGGVGGVVALALLVVGMRLLRRRALG